MNTALDRKLPTAAEDADRIDGRTMTGTADEKKQKKVLDELRIHKTITPSHLKAVLNMSREHISRAILKPMLAKGIIERIPNTQGMYKLAEDKNTSKESHISSRVNAASIFNQSKNMAEWKDNEDSKRGKTFLTRFTKIVTGGVNPDYKIHPDSINRDNWQEKIKILIAAVNETTGRTRLASNDIQTIRNFIQKGLSITVGLSVGKKLGIDNPIEKPKAGHLRLTEKQYAEIKSYFKSHFDKETYCKLGCKIWLFMRPSALYPLKTKDFNFYDKTTKFVQVGEERIYSTEVLRFVELLSIANPNLRDQVKIQTKVTRAASVEVHEYKNSTTYKRFIFDEDFVIPLESYLKKRKILNKKYAFWNSNDTVFTFENYDSIVRTTVNKDLKIMQEGLDHLGFSKEDTGGHSFRGNYAMRHIGIQRWLIMTGYNYELISEMSHDNINILKDWYGRKDTATVEKELQQV